MLVRGLFSIQIWRVCLFELNSRSRALMVVAQCSKSVSERRRDIWRNRYKNVNLHSFSYFLMVHEHIEFEIIPTHWIAQWQCPYETIKLKERLKHSTKIHSQNTRRRDEIFAASFDWVVKSHVYVESNLTNQILFRYELIWKKTISFSLIKFMNDWENGNLSLRKSM